MALWTSISKLIIIMSWTMDQDILVCIGELKLGIMPLARQHKTSNLDEKKMARDPRQDVESFWAETETRR